MAILQDSFTANRGKAYPGMLQGGSAQHDLDAFTVINETGGNTTSLRMGYVAIKPSSANTAYHDKAVEEFRGANGGAYAAFFEGVAIRQFGKKGVFQTELEQEERYANGQTADVVYRGKVTVLVKSDVVRGQPVAVGADGNYTNASTVGAFIIPNAFYLEAGSLNSLVKIQLSGKGIMTEIA